MGFLDSLKNVFGGSKITSPNTSTNYKSSYTAGAKSNFSLGGNSSLKNFGSNNKTSLSGFDLNAIPTTGNVNSSLTLPSNYGFGNTGGGTIKMPKKNQFNAVIPALNLGGNASTSSVAPEDVQAAVESNVTPTADYGSGQVDYGQQGTQPYTPPQPEQLSIKDQAMQGIINELNSTDSADAREQLRKEMEVEEKAKIKNELQNRMRLARVNYEADMEEIEKNKSGSFGPTALNSRMNKLTTDYNRNLAYNSISYDIANDDYTAAYNTVQSRIADIEAESKRRTDLYQVLFNFAQNDMTESEKLQANQAFDREMKALDLANSKELISYQSVIDAQAAIEANKLAVPSLMDTAGDIQGLIMDLENRDVANVVGAHPLARFSLDRGFSAQDENFIGGVEQLISKRFLDKLISVKAEGGTFGALSYPEQKALTDAATKIGSWRIRKDNEPDGQVIGYDINEAGMSKELKTVLSITQRAIKAAGGDINSDPLGIAPDMADPLNLGI